MSVQPEWVFETTDYAGTPVVLSQSTWQSKAGNDESGTHPEIHDYLVDVRAAIESPTLVFQSTAMNVHVSSTGLVLDGVSSLVST